MPTRQISPSISQTGSRRFTRALALAFNEWLLMLMLFANSIFSYVITKFADYYELQSPCLMCSRLDHILRRTKKSHWDMVCAKHKSEISSLVYCHAHGKLVDVRGMCEACLFSFATTNKSNAETYRLLVGKLGEDSSFGSKSDPTNTNSRYCTCCNQLCLPLTSSTDQVLAKPVAPLPKIRLGGNMRTGKQSTTPKKSVRFNHLPHVGYTELKFHSDTESEAVFSEDEGVIVKEEDHRFQNVDLETPKVITLPYDLATDKLLNLEPLVARNDREEVHLQEINMRTCDFFFPELVPVNGVPETSEKVLKEEEIISLDDLFLTSRAMEQNSVAVLKEKEDLIHFQDISLTPHFKEGPADALMEETELIPVNGVPETSEKVLKKEEIISLNNLFLTSRSMEHSAAVMKAKEDLIHLQDVTSTSVSADTHEDLFIGETVLQGKEELVHLQETSLTTDSKEDSANALMEETELICLKDVTSTSVPEDILMGKTVLHGKEELVQLQDVSLTPADALMEETELLCLDEVTSTSVAVETPEDILKEETVLQEKEELVHLQDISLTPADVLMEERELLYFNDVTSASTATETPKDLLKEETVIQGKEELVHLQDTSVTPDFKGNPADALMEETKLINLNDVTTSTSSDAAETPEDVLKRIEVMPLHDISVDEVTPVETLKERDINQDDTNSLESEYVVVSPSKSTKSMPENSTENCATENKETKETSLTVSSVSEMAAPESESSSFNSMSVAAETNIGSGESWLKGGELLNLADAYNNIVHNDGSKDSNEGAHIEQWMKKDTSRVSEDLKALLTQISASRGIEFLSPRDISPKISSDQETKNLDLDMQLLIQKRMLERNESNLSLEGVSVSEIEGESESDRLKRQVDHDRKLLTGLYKELEEERSASAVATNQAMAMITRLQEEKALFQMEALQNLRMMEEQAEYDMEAIQKLNDLLVEREKLIQDLEAEIDYFRDQTPQKKNESKIDSPSVSNKVQNCLTGFNEERLYITSCLEKIENRVQTDGEAHVDDLETQESVSEVRERVEKLKGDMYFLEHVVNSLGHGNEGVQFVKEIASHLQTLRSLSMKRHNDTVS